jgi:hypothetical protein
MKNMVKLFWNLNRARSAKVPLLIIAFLTVTALGMTTCEWEYDEDFDYFEDLSILTGTWVSHTQYGDKTSSQGEVTVDSTVIFSEVKNGTINMELEIKSKEIKNFKESSGGNTSTGSQFFDALYGLIGLPTGTPYHPSTSDSTYEYAFWEMTYTLEEINEMGWTYTIFPTSTTKKEITLNIGKIVPKRYAQCDCTSCPVSPCDGWCGYLSCASNVPRANITVNKVNKK